MDNELIKTLKKYPQWVYWKKVKDEKGKERKIPINIKTKKYASVSDSNTWSSYDKVGCHHQWGFILSEEDPFTVIDLDHCIGPFGQVKSETTRILLYFQSYTEISPSRTGFHIWVRGKLPSAIKRPDFEIYSSRRYITVTGNAAFNCQVANCQLHLDKIYEKYGTPNFGSEEIYDTRNCYEDLRRLYHVSEQLRRIWNLECNFKKADGSPDCSGYDMALAGLLRDWSGEQITWAIKFFREKQGFAPKHKKAIALTISRAKNNT